MHTFHELSLLEHPLSCFPPHGPQILSIGFHSGEEAGRKCTAGRSLPPSLPGMAAVGQRLPVRRALEARAGQVVQGDGGLQVEQVGGAALGLVLDRGAAGPELEGPLGGGGARMRSTRAHSAGPSPRGRATWRPRLRRVRWRTLEPQRTERTRRWVKWGSLAPGAGAGGGPADEQAPMGAGLGAGVREL